MPMVMLSHVSHICNKNIKKLRVIAKYAKNALTDKICHANIWLVAYNAKTEGGEWMVNVNKLKGKIVECGMNIEQIAEKTGINKSTFYRKMNDKGDSFTISEVDKIAKALRLTGKEVNGIFFSQYVA